MIMLSIDIEVVKILRDSLRDKGTRQILTEDEYDALIHTNAKIAGCELAHGVMDEKEVRVQFEVCMDCAQDCHKS